MQLLILPAVLAFGVVFLNERQNTADKDRADKQATVTAASTQNQTRDAVLDDYMSEISDLLLKENLVLAAGVHCPPTAKETNGVPKTVAQVVAIARARTLTALQRLDGVRQALLVRFLVESGLIPAVSLSIASLPKVNLSGMDLRCARLQYASLPHAYLSYAKLSGANLSDADLSYTLLYRTDLSLTHLDRADLSGAVIVNTNLSGAYLKGANLSGAAVFNPKLSHVHWDHTTCPDDTSPKSCGKNQLRSPHVHIDLAGVSLPGADLSAANLSDADLSGADLSRTSLKRAHLNDANLSGASLSGVHWDHTTCPDSTNSATNGTKPQSCKGHGG
jgi:uncharacterized protein YjbI with pentapeptide repeats